MKKLLFILCLFTSITSYEQEPTLTETLDYIKLKTATCEIWYNPYSEVTSTGCDERLSYYMEAKQVSLLDKPFYPYYLLFKSKCANMEYELKLNLKWVESIELIDGAVKLSSSKALISVYSRIDPNNISTIEPNINKWVKFYRVDDPEKLVKALKHYFKLLNIKLIDDKF